MSRALLIDYGGKMQNHALMQVSTDLKSQGYEVQLTDKKLTGAAGHYDKVICSVLFTWDKPGAEALAQIYPHIQYGGTGWSKTNRLPAEVEAMKPDYSLYTPEHLTRVQRGKTPAEKAKKADQLLRSAIGRTTTGCVRSCDFCFIPEKEGRLQQTASIEDLITDWCDELILLDNNLTADPLMVEKLAYLREYNTHRRRAGKKGVRLNITQGVDCRGITDEKAMALAKTTHSAQLHIAWDLMRDEKSVRAGIATLLQHMGASRLMCYMLIGHNTTPEEDAYRFRTLRELGITPYVMVYNKRKDTPWLKHFPRYVNGRLYTVCSLDDYMPWRRDGGQITMDIRGMMA